MADVSPTRAECEDFLYGEASLLDEWRLSEWLALFEEGATYEVPTSGAAADADSSQQLFLIADDYARLRHRVNRLNKPGAHSEWPRSHTVRTISNVRVLDHADGQTKVACAFITYRSKADVTAVFFGHHHYVLQRRADGSLGILSKRTMLDASSLRPQGRVSIIP